MSEEERISLHQYIDKQFEAHGREHAQMNAALDLARSEVNRRLEDMNELREQLYRERGTFVVRQAYEAHLEHAHKLEGRIQRLETVLTGATWMIAILFPAVVAILVSRVVSFVFP